MRITHYRKVILVLLAIFSLDLWARTPVRRGARRAPIRKRVPIKTLHESFPKWKLSTDIITTFGYGDLNFRVESPKENDTSWLVIFHHNPDSERAKETGTSGIGAGHRTYTQVLGGWWHIEDYFQFNGFYDQATPDNNPKAIGSETKDEGEWAPGFALVFGLAKKWPKELISNVEIGISRKFQEGSKTKAYFAYGLGIALF